MKSPTADRTVHIDRYSGKILADIRFEDYNDFGKFMAAGSAIHMGTLGLWSVFANVLFCLLICDCNLCERLCHVVATSSS